MRVPQIRRIMCIAWMTEIMVTMVIMGIMVIMANNGGGGGGSDSNTKKKRGGCGACGGGFYIPVSTAADTSYETDAAFTSYVDALKEEAVVLMKRLVVLLTDKVATLAAEGNGSPARHTPAPTAPVQTPFYPVSSRLRARISSL